MAEKKQLWLARASDDFDAAIYDRDPGDIRNDKFRIEGFLCCSPALNRRINIGHKAPLTIGEAVDCRKPVVPSLTLSRDDCGTYWVDFGNNVECAYGRTFPIELERMTECRIAWDESGIRLIGTPERI